MRAIKKVHGDKPSHWIGDGFHVKTLISHFSEDPDFNYQHTDPFLLFDYGLPRTFAPNIYYDTHPYGVSQHPHRGFETVTIAYAGQLSHADSAGGCGTISEGDVKWITAGRGIMHEEFHSKDFGQHGGVFSMVQMWINLPQADKLTAPNHQTIRRTNMPVIDLYSQASEAGDNATGTAYKDTADGQVTDNSIKIGSATIIAGEYQDKRGAATTFTPVNLWNIELLTTGVTTLNVPDSHNVMLLVQEGELLVNDTLVDAGKLIQFAAPTKQTTPLQTENSESQQSSSSSTDVIELNYPVTSDSVSVPVKLLLLSGEPIGEPIASYGPFVMTTADELERTLHDYQTGNFG
ncbi:redox-sensitive bicupin YhaK (pirin superfamily) [Psychrobacter sp. PL19]|uniref:pirin family protein n=1 Tax=Psychrobacter sp. PL19 TaxID=2760711 RepID=UPI001AE1450E